MDHTFYVHPTAVVDDDTKIGEQTKIWHFSHVQSGAIIGRNATLGQNVYIASNVLIGNFVKIQNNVSVYEGVTLEDYVFCGPSVVFTNVRTPRCRFPRNDSSWYEKTLVKHGASIGANATIVCGVVVGEHALIGAGSVVTKSIAPHALVVGNPSRQIGWVCECGVRLKERCPTRLCCTVCNLIYIVDSTGLRKD